jgi:hypothetical protein
MSAIVIPEDTWAQVVPVGFASVGIQVNGVWGVRLQNAVSQPSNADWNGIYFASGVRDTITGAAVMGLWARSAQPGVKGYIQVLEG